MSYKVYSKNNPNGFDINEGTLNEPPSGNTSLKLVGKDYFGYGEAIAQNFVNLLQNFASNTAPAKPIEGQLWFNPSKNFLSVWKANDANDPVVDTAGSWMSIDVSSSGPTIVYDDTQTVGGNLYHEVNIIRDNDIPVAAFSSEAEFTINSNDPLNGSFKNNLIKPGITLGIDTTMRFHGTATSAEYADLAELYSSDKEYEAGTIVKIGGEAEVTETTYIRDEDVFGVVSTDPAYLMNSMLQGTSVPVALAGRVPCKVEGEITKGQRLTSSDTPGVAIAATHDATHRQVIGRALENKTTDEVGLVEIIVGVK